MFWRRKSYQDPSKPFNFGTQQINERNSTPDLPIVNAITGVHYPSLNEQRRIQKLKENGIDMDVLEFKNDPYLELLEGLRVMSEYFKTSTYDVITRPKDLATLEEIKRNYYVGENKELRIDNEVFTYNSDIRVKMSLLEIIRVMSLNGKIILVDKGDTVRLYRELEKTITLADPENKLSYNRLPHDPGVIAQMQTLKKDLEVNENWIFYVPPTEEINVMGKTFGSLYDILSGFDAYTEKDKQARNQMDEKLNLDHIYAYRKRT